MRTCEEGRSLRSLLDDHRARDLLPDCRNASRLTRSRSNPYNHVSASHTRLYVDSSTSCQIRADVVGGYL